MEFHEKLQELRRQKGLTQEELAEALFVSRTAVSKWESGRGYPNIDSLKELSKFFSVTLDELLSSDEILVIAKKDQEQTETHLRDLVLGLLDISNLMLLFLPFFAERTDAWVRSVSLLSLENIQPYLKAAYFAIVLGTVLIGVLLLAFQNCQNRVWVRAKYKASLSINAIGVLLFILSLHPYVAVFALTVLIIKALLLIKWQ